VLFVGHKTMEVNLEARIINVHWEGHDCGGDGREP
jgi:hypothetical protein